MRVPGRIRNIFKKASIARVSLKRSPLSEPKLFYAGCVPRSNEIAHGGSVKLLSLSQFYSESNPANILYLVSSALPLGVESWIKKAKKAGIKIVLNQNGVAYPAWAGPNYNKINVPIRHAIEASDYIFYQSEFCKKTVQRFVCTPTAPHSTIFNPVNIEDFRPQRQNTRPTLLLGGSQYQKYKIELALDILSEVKKTYPDILLVITGSINWNGNEKECLSIFRSQVKLRNLENQIELTGPYLQSKAPEIFSKCHILLHPKFNDPCPTTVLEAMASGLAVVSTTSGGIPELVGPDGLPFLISTPETYTEDLMPDAGQWTQMIRIALNQRQKVGPQMIHRAETEFSTSRWIDRQKSVFKNLVS